MKEKLCYRNRIMYLLVFLELLLGDISWSRDVIMALIVESPTTPNIMKVSAFLYGNGVPLRISSTFFGLCNSFGGLDVLNGMHSVYHMGFQGRNVHDRAPYYDVTYKEMYWINDENSFAQSVLGARCAKRHAFYL